jgi:hypothetical protein
LDVEHVRGHHDPALIAFGRGQMLELHVHRADALRHVDVESVNIAWIARPGNRASGGADAQPCDRGDRPARRMIAGQPLRVEQGQPAGAAHRDRLLDPKDRPRGVARIDVDRQRAGIGDVLRLRQRLREDDRLRPAFPDLSGGGESGGRGEGEQGELTQRTSLPD